MERVLVGVDGSPAARHALGWAADLAARASLDLLALRVIERADAEVPDPELAARRQSLHEELEEWCATLPGPCARPVVTVVAGDPPQVLSGTASAEHADLVVIGSRGVGELLHLGNVARNLVSTTTAPVAVVGPGASITTSSIVVAYDRRGDHTPAAAMALELARRLAVPVTVVYSFSPYGHEDPDADPLVWHESVVAEVRRWATPFAAAGVTVDVYVDRERDVDRQAAVESALRDRPGSIAVVDAEASRQGAHLLRAIVRHSGHAVILMAPTVPSRPGDGSTPRQPGVAHQDRREEEGSRLST